ncbi:MAG: hypothetical protein NTV04_21690, partial [Deltaproteobacteria bacterium]|nr:hypothetical protein [Deltaproteobacteria bacterium]
IWFPPEEAGGIFPAPAPEKSAPYDSKRAGLAPGPWNHLDLSRAARRAAPTFRSHEVEAQSRSKRDRWTFCETIKKGGWRWP